VKLCRPGIEGDADLRSKMEESVDRTLLGRAHVRRRDNPDLAAPADDALQRLTEVTDTGPDHERANQVDRHEFGLQLGVDVRLAFGVD